MAWGLVTSVCTVELSFSRALNQCFVLALTSDLPVKCECKCTYIYRYACLLGCVCACFKTLNHLTWKCQTFPRWNQRIVTALSPGPWLNYHSFSFMDNTAILSSSDGLKCDCWKKKKGKARELEVKSNPFSKQQKGQCWRSPGNRLPSLKTIFLSGWILFVAFLPVYWLPHSKTR